MSKISCLKHDSEEATVDIGAFPCSFVVNRDNVTALFGNNIGNALKLTGFINKLNKETAVSARARETALDNTA